MKLVPDAKNAWKWVSMWCMAASTIAPSVWLAIPVEMREAIPVTWLAFIAIGLGVAGMIGRLWNQGGSDV
jgi:hypothetical protein